MKQERDSGKLGLAEKIVIGAGSAVGTFAAGFGEIASGSGMEMKIGGIPVNNYLICAVPFVITIGDYVVQRLKGNNEQLFSKRYLKSLGVGVIGSGVGILGLFGLNEAVRYSLRNVNFI